jgi:hypothetical protein
VTAASLIFVGIYLYEVVRGHSAEVLTVTNLVRIGVGVLVYVATQLLIAIAWINIINTLSESKLSMSDGLCIYAVSQVFKYLPSNVLHTVGRYAMTKARGQSHQVVLLAQASDMLLVSLAAATVVGVFGWKLISDNFPDLASQVGWRSGVMAVVIIAALVGLVAHTIFRNPLAPLRLGLSYLMFVVFFVISGMIAAGLLYGVSWTEFAVHAPEIVGVVAAAWLGGWATPGASAGIGVREALIILLLSTHIGAEAAAFMAVAYRIVTTVGDLLFALIGLIITQFSGKWDVLLLGSEPVAR